MELIKWANVAYDELFDSNEYEFLKYRLSNDILVGLKDMEEDFEDITCLNQDEKMYVIGVFKRFLSQLKGDINYTETYKVTFSNDDFDINIKEVIEESYQLLSKDNELSPSLFNSLKGEISTNSCLTKKDILILEIMNSMLLINESYKSKSNEVFIGMLGKTEESYKRSDEIEYLNKLYSVFKGECEFRFSLTLRADNVLYTNIFFI